MADQGINSQSRHTQDVSSFAQRSAGEGRAHPVEEPPFQVRVVEEPAPRPGSDDGGLAGDHAEPFPCGLLITADNDDRPRAHVLFLTDDLWDALVAEIGERFGRVLQQPGGLAGLAGRHRGRKVDQPPGVSGEPAHHLERRSGVLLPDGDVAPEPVRDETLAQHVLGVEHLVVDLLSRLGRCPSLGRQERSRRFAVRTDCGHRHELLLRVAEGGEFAAENAAGVDVDRPVQPVGLRNRCMTIDDHRLTSVFRRPVEADGQAELVGLAGGFPVEGEVTNLGRAPSLHLLLHPGVSDNELAVVEDVVAHEAVEEVGQFPLERDADRFGQCGDLGERVGQAVGDLHILAPELPHELQVVVAWYAQRCAMDHHVPHQAYGLEDPGAAVHEIAQEDSPAALGMDEGPVAPERIVAVQAGLHVAEASEQTLQLFAAAVHIADDVKRAALVSLVVPQRNALNDRRLDLLGRLEHEHVPEALMMEPSQRPSELRLLVADDVGTKLPVRPISVPFLTDLFGQVKNNGHRQAVIMPGQLHQRLASLGLDVGGVDHREPTQGEPLAGDEPEQLERLVRDGLVVLIVADHPSAGIRRENLRRLEVPAREGALARAAGTDQDDEAEVGDLDGHEKSRLFNPLIEPSGEGCEPGASRGHLRGADLLEKFTGMPDLCAVGLGILPLARVLRRVGDLGVQVGLGLVLKV